MKPWSDTAIVVLGHREPGVSAEHRISAESLDRLAVAARLARRHRPRAVILTGYTATGGRSEAEQMQSVWPLPGIQTICENEARDTAENAARCLPIVEGLGVRRVVLVSSVWHLRAPYFFSPYRRRGLRVRWRPSLLGTGWRLIHNELRRAHGARRARQDAYRAVGINL